jgi:hypothetical protein
MKIVFEYNWNVEHEASGTETIPFEYSSIEDFQFMVLEKIKEHKEKCIKEYGNIDFICLGILELFEIDWLISKVERS